VHPFADKGTCSSFRFILSRLGEKSRLSLQQRLFFSFFPQLAKMIFGFFSVFLVSFFPLQQSICEPIFSFEGRSPIALPSSLPLRSALIFGAGSPPS